MKYQMTMEQQKEIEKARKENKNKNIEKRLRVLSLKAEGSTYKEIIRITGYSKASVANIIKLYFEKGIEEIVTNKYGGNHRNLSYEEECKFLEKFEKEALKGQIVEVKEIKEAYEKKVGHRIGNGQIYTFLKRHNWRKIMPRSRHPKKANEEAIEASKKLSKL